MARPPFSVSIRGNASLWRPHGSYTHTCLDATFASENAQGPKQKKPKGFKPPTNYSLEADKYHRATGSIDRYESGFLAARVRGVVGGAAPIEGFDSLNRWNTVHQMGAMPSSIIDQALIKARIGMKNGSVNLGVAFAERNRTAQLLGDTAISLVNAYRDLRRGQWKKAARTLGLTKPKEPRGKSLPQKWLEYQYGWQPMLNDVYGSCQALAERDRYDWLVTSRGRQQVPVRIYNKSIGAFVSLETNVSGFDSAFVRIDAVPKNDLLMAFTSLGLTNPALVAWELVPFSFLVDWALPIGEWLESLDAMLGYDSNNTWSSISTLQRRYWRSFGIDGVSGPFSNICRFEDYREKTSMRRYAAASVPLPMLPRFKDPVSLGHMANGLSLLASVFGGRA